LILEGVGSAQDAEECVNDLFVTAWQEFDAFDPERGSLRTWLTIRARYIALDRRRQLIRHSPSDRVASLSKERTLAHDQPISADLEQEKQPNLPMAAGIDTLLEQREQRQAMYAALKRLPELACFRERPESRMAY